MSDLDNFLNSVENGTDEVAVPFTTKETVTHKLTILCVRAKNFRSIGNEFMEMRFDQHQSLLVVSDENGSGKSTLCVWAAYYALTGKPYEKREKVTGLVNTASNREMLVELEFIRGGNHYKVRRGRKGQVEFDIQILTGGVFKTIEADAAKADWQNYLWELLGLEPKNAAKIIENVFILGKEKYQPFIEMGAEDRRNLVEPIWDLGIFSKWNEHIKEQTRVAKSNLNDQLEHEKECQTKLDVAMAQLESAEKLESVTKTSGEATNETYADALKSADSAVKEAQSAYDNSDSEINAIEVRYSQRKEERLDEARSFKEEIDGRVKSAVDGANSKVRSIEEVIKSTNETHDRRIGEIAQIVPAAQNDLDIKLKTINEKMTGLEADQVAHEHDLEVAEETLSKFVEGNDEAVMQSKLDAKRTQKAQFEKFSTQFSTQLGTLNESIERLKSIGECPTCRQHVTDEHIKACAEAIQPQVDELAKKLNSAQDMLGKVNDEIDQQHTQLQSVIDNRIQFEKEVREAKELLAETNRKIDAVNQATKVAQDAFEAEKARAERERKAEEDMYEIEMNRLQHELDEAKSDIGTVAEDTRALLEKQHESMLTKADQIDEECQSEIDALTKRLQDAIAVANAKLTEATTRYKERLEKHEADVRDAAIKVEQASEAVEAAKEAVTVANDNCKAAEAELQDWEDLKVVLSDKEGKADIIRKYMPFLNQKVNEYLEALGMFIKFTLDETFNVSMEAPDRKNQSIFSLSSGQRARVNLAILFALRDVANLKASVQCNLLVLDEILENLSERGVTDAVTMIKHRFGDSNLAVVTQRASEFEEHFEHKIVYGLRGGFTTQIG